MTRHNYLDALPYVKDRNDFARWLVLLARDYRHNPQEWAPQNISDFLTFLAAYLEQDFPACTRTSTGRHRPPSRPGPSGRNLQRRPQPGVGRRCGGRADQCSDRQGAGMCFGLVRECSVITRILGPRGG